MCHVRRLVYVCAHLCRGEGWAGRSECGFDSGVFGLVLHGGALPAPCGARSGPSAGSPVATGTHRHSSLEPELPMPRAELVSGVSDQRDSAWEPVWKPAINGVGFQGLLDSARLLRLLLKWATLKAFPLNAERE